MAPFAKRSIVKCCVQWRIVQSIRVKSDKVYIQATYAAKRWLCMHACSLACNVPCAVQYCVHIQRTSLRKRHCDAVSRDVYIRRLFQFKQCPTRNPTRCRLLHDESLATSRLYIQLLRPWAVGYRTHAGDLDEYQTIYVVILYVYRCVRAWRRCLRFQNNKHEYFMFMIIMCVKPRPHCLQVVIRMYNSTRSRFRSTSRL
jgi:hypothetical protein